MFRFLFGVLKWSRKENVLRIETSQSRLLVPPLAPQKAGHLRMTPTIYEKLKPLVTDKCPFVNLPETGRARWGDLLDAEKMKQCIWVRPKLVAVIEFLEWTEGDRLRHSKFVALRDDKDPREVTKVT